MNIDKRLEAVAMNLELAFRDFQEVGARIDKLAGRMATLAAAMTELARVANDHAQCLSNLEGQ